MLQRLVIAPDQLQDQKISLTADQGHYLCRVLRLRAGDRFIAMDGQGQSWLTRLLGTDVSFNSFQAEILEAIAVETELPVAVTLVMALPKGSGFDEVVRQATELGVACIVPVISDRTLLNPNPQKVERWRRIAQEAAEQSERQIVPNILDPILFAASLQDPPFLDSGETDYYLCVTRRESPHLFDCLVDHGRSTMSDQQSLQRIVLAIGPEGGWTDEEIERAINTGYRPVSLGTRIFRAVTAPLVALAIIAAFYEAERANDLSCGR